MAEQSLPVFILACVACGKTVSGREDKCPRCGASFDGMEFECPFCGEKVTTSHSKCPFCETEFEIFAEEVAETSSVELDSSGSETPAAQKPDAAEPEKLEYECPACGKPVGESDDKCPHCGAMFSE
jgi:rubrerythrin